MGRVTETDILEKIKKRRRKERKATSDEGDVRNADKEEYDAAPQNKMPKRMAATDLKQSETIEVSTDVVQMNESEVVSNGVELLIAGAGEKQNASSQQTTKSTIHQSESVVSNKSGSELTKSYGISVKTILERCKKFSFLRRREKSDLFYDHDSLKDYPLFCQVCNVRIGPKVNQASDHEKSSSHEKNAKFDRGTTKISDFLVTSSGIKSENPVIKYYHFPEHRAYEVIVQKRVEKGMSMNQFHGFFNDKDVQVAVKSINYIRSQAYLWTKTESVGNRRLKEILSEAEGNFYSLSIDESSLDDQRGLILVHINTYLNTISLPVFLKGEDSWDQICVYSVVSDVLNSLAKYSNSSPLSCLALISDNASNMKAGYNLCIHGGGPQNLPTLTRNAAVYGCIAHVLDLMVKAVWKCFARSAELASNLYTFGWQGGDKRARQFRLSKIAGKDALSALNSCQTRWLSLTKAAEFIAKKKDKLLEWVQNEDTKSSKKDLLIAQLQDPVHLLEVDIVLDLLRDFPYLTRCAQSRELGGFGYHCLRKVEDVRARFEAASDEKGAHDVLLHVNSVNYSDACPLQEFDIDEFLANISKACEKALTKFRHCETVLKTLRFVLAFVPYEVIASSVVGSADRSMAIPGPSEFGSFGMVGGDPILRLSQFTSEDKDSANSEYEKYYNFLSTAQRYCRDERGEIQSTRIEKVVPKLKDSKYFWHSGGLGGRSFPGLAKVARALLCFKATTARVEGDFSSEQSRIPKERALMKDNHMKLELLIGLNSEVGKSDKMPPNEKTRELPQDFGRML